MNSISSIGLGISPIIAIVLILYIVFFNKRKNVALLIKSYILGGSSAFLSVPAVYFAKISGMAVFDNLSDSLIFSFFIVGFFAELGKFIVLKLFILHHKEVVFPIHGMVYSVITSLGFSTMVAIFYFANFLNLNPPYPANMFILLVGPANIVFGIILGFFLGMAKFLEKSFVFNIAGLISSTFFSGLFTFCLLSHDYKLLSLFSFGSSIIVMVLIIRLFSAKT